jgi:SAM-dependent methyltransferase
VTAAMQDRNQRLSESARNVDYYRRFRGGELFPAERIVRDELRARLTTITMLDIGIGAGRTVPHFAPFVKKYVGIDYAQGMVKASREQFATLPGDITFTNADARDLSSYATASFDLVLFSFNGLDYMPHADRLRTLREIKRVGRPGGRFLFSSHNLQDERVFSLGSRTFLRPTALVRYVIIHALNPDLRAQRQNGWAFLRGAGHGLRLDCYFITPEQQRKQLKDHGFSDVHLYSFEDGRDLSNVPGHTVTEGAVYYSCRF